MLYEVATVVKKRAGETEDGLIARFRKKIQNEQLLIELKEQQFHKKPSQEKNERLAPKRRAKKRRKKRS